MDERQLRVGKNEAVFRQVNEQVESLNEAFATVTEVMVLVCECGDQSCLERLEVTQKEYEEVRADPRLFAIRPGHEVSDVESVVAKNERYWVVEKRPGEPARVAEETDPRTPPGEL